MKPRRNPLQQRRRIQLLAHLADEALAAILDQRLPVLAMATTDAEQRASVEVEVELDTLCHQLAEPRVGSIRVAAGDGAPWHLQVQIIRTYQHAQMGPDFLDLVGHQQRSEIGSALPGPARIQAHVALAVELILATIAFVRTERHLVAATGGQEEKRAEKRGAEQLHESPCDGYPRHGPGGPTQSAAV